MADLAGSKEGLQALFICIHCPDCDDASTVLGKCTFHHCSAVFYIPVNRPYKLETSTFVCSYKHKSATIFCGFHFVALCGGKLSMSLETNLRHLIISQTGKHGKEIKRSCRDECLGNIFMISLPGKKAMPLLCQFTSQSCVQSLTQHGLMVSRWQRDLNISFRMKYFIICHFSPHALQFIIKVYRKQLCKRVLWASVEEKLTLCSFHMPQFSCVGASASLCV